jgi:hypothetical protein
VRREIPLPHMRDRNDDQKQRLMLAENHVRRFFCGDVLGDFVAELHCVDICEELFAGAENGW